MAKQAQKPVSQESSEVFVGQTPLSEAALEIYKSRQASMQGISPARIAQESFAAAKAFVDEEARIRNGGGIYEPSVVTDDLFMVDKWDPVYNKQLFDENTNEPIVEEVRGDHAAFAPNLPAEHPANQKYYRSCVRLGIPVTSQKKELQEAANKYKRGLAASRN